MTRAWCMLVCILLLLVPRAAGAQEGKRESVEEPVDCPVHCSPSEACIEHRCVETCRVSCRQGTICTAAGACQPLPKPEKELLTEADLQRLSGQESADSRWLVFADLAGILGYGLKLGLEYGEQGSFVSRMQFLNVGLLNYAAYVQNEHQRFEWGFGASLAYRRYEGMGGNLRGFYYGGGLDYAVIRVVGREGNGVYEVLHSLAPLGEFGYRWVFGTTAIGFGPTVALRYPIGSEFSGADLTECPPPYNCEGGNVRSFEGTMHFEIGWFQ